LLLLLLHQLSAQGDEVGEDGHQVNDVHDVAKEGGLAGAGRETHQQLESEPYNAKRFHQKEGISEEGAPKSTE
jgi:hypothetical protein